MSGSTRCVTATVDLVGLVIELEDDDRIELLKELIANIDNAGTIAEMRTIINDPCYDD